MVCPNEQSRQTTSVNNASTNSHYTPCGLADPVYSGDAGLTGMVKCMWPVDMPHLLVCCDQHADANAMSVSHLSILSTQMPTASVVVLLFMLTCGRIKL